MSTRLPQGGRFIDRNTPLAFTFNGKPMRGFQGDTLASALLAQGQSLVGRSFKYHRPRGIVASGVEEPNALINLGQGAQFEPNQRATTTELVADMIARSQNHWPSLEYDIGALNGAFSRFLPAGFYYKMFLQPRAFWKHLYEPFIRQSAGLGQAPDQADPDHYSYRYAHTDLLIIGGGIAGLLAARIAAESGAQVMLIEQTPHWGGRAPVDDKVIDGLPVQEWIDMQVSALEAMDNVEMRLRCMGAGVYDHGYVLAHENLGDHKNGAAGPRHQLWRIRTRHIVTATGAIERPLSFANNDLPGVMLAAAMRDYVQNYAVSPGDRTVVMTNNDDAYRTALCLNEAGLTVPAIVDTRQAPRGDLIEAARAAGIEIRTGQAISAVLGGNRVRAVTLCSVVGEGAPIAQIDCDCVAMSGGWSPVVHLWSHCGGKLVWDAGQLCFIPDPDRPPLGADGQGMVSAIGSASGAVTCGAVLAQTSETLSRVVALLGLSPSNSISASTPLEVQGLPMAAWVLPMGAHQEKRAKMWLDFQNDVKVSDVQLAAREGFESVEHAKRYTTLGMATDQGKLSNINGLAILAEARGSAIAQVGTTTFRPPYAPISLASLGGEARGELFQPVRKTPMHEWHEAQAAHWEPVGHWRRPYTYPRTGEDLDAAVQREITNTRTNVGLLDASTLGKILVKGPDAGRFLDMLYTNMMSTLKIGRCRYGLMCSENGFLVDDGVVVRLSEDSWLCHTTSGGADNIHAHMEEWLQTEWWDWQVYTANLTEQYAQIAVVGPKARELLTQLGGLDVSADTLPFMGWVEGVLAGHRVRIFRISFSGELSYEIAVPANEGRALWDKLIAAGEAFGIMPYGTEALHVMRAEKGFIMIGDETDGTVIPQDLGLGWAISKKKEDYLGKRAQTRAHMTDPTRWKLVGLETLDGSVLPDGAYALAEGENANGQRNTQGRVTSTYFSPTLGKGIAMGLVLHGPDRMGEVLDFPSTDGKTYQARICDPVFFDPEGTKQNA